MLPVSGALQLSTNGARNDRPVCSATEALGVVPRVLGREEEVPQPLLAGLGLELRDDRQRCPGVAAGLPEPGDLALVGGLDGLDLGVDEGTDPLGEVRRARRWGEVHVVDPRTLLSNAQ
jgi:hypothetical protein